ncbi:hypothetical protein [Neisseria meningitidis]|uniref:hypothetical protein n=1 Tax=Neisseria meningitidis TaxID=487 RepID=UPI0013DE8383|nr:hypothetical protein [Neisseria meningitidis]
MPSEPSDGIFDAPAVYRRGAGVHFRGNDVVQVSVWMDSSFPTTPQSRNSSFPRRRESSPLTRRESIGK